MERAKCYEKMFYVLEVGILILNLFSNGIILTIMENKYCIFSTIMETLRYVDT